MEVRLILRSDDGRSRFGCAADWPSFGWLDKRADMAPRQKLIELLELTQLARRAYLANSDFDSVFDCWSRAHADFYAMEEVKSAVPLCCSFAIALIERALIDAFCRIENIPLFEALTDNRLGFEPAKIHSSLEGRSLADSLPPRPASRIYVKHTVGPGDPLTEAELTSENRLNDGLPQTLEDYVRQDGIQFFKIKIGGNPDADLMRLKLIWAVIRNVDPTITLDGNEAYDDVGALRGFVEQLSKTEPELFRRIQFIEQPMSRANTHDRNHADEIKAIAAIKPLIIDEADGYLDAFKEALEIGYVGVSHKNCKGVFKSLANFLLAESVTGVEPQPFLSAEDLTVMPVVSLHQDLAVVAALGLTSVERNAHHFFAGLAHLTDAERLSALTHYPLLYEQRDSGVLMKIQDGQIDLSNLQVAGMGVVDLPEFEVMSPLEDWIDELKASLDS